MIVVADNGTSSYFIEKASSIKLENNTNEFKERYPVAQGGLYTIKLYFDPANLNLLTTLGRYDNYDAAWSMYASLLAAIAEGRSAFDFSGQIFQMYEEPDMEEEHDLQEEQEEQL